MQKPFPEKTPIWAVWDGKWARGTVSRYATLMAGKVQVLFDCGERDGGPWGSRWYKVQDVRTDEQMASHTLLT